MNRAALARLGAAIIAAAAIASCSAVRSDVSIPASEALAPTTSVASTTTTVTASNTAQLEDDGCEQRSFRPMESIPTPGEMPANSTMRAIQDRGTLRVVVDDSTLFFSSRDVDGELQGFEAELARELAFAIFGDRDKVELIIGGVGAAKLRSVRDGAVYPADAVIDVVTISCARWSDVAFTRPYYETTQGILVAHDAETGDLADLDDSTVCVTRGSSSENYVEEELPGTTVLAVGSRTDCLVALQEGRSDAVVLPVSILEGLHAQDATTRIIVPDDPPPEIQYYGIAVPQRNTDFVRFVNGLLERWQADGTLARMQQEHLPEALRPDSVLPSSEYRD
jgi:polar amino acid transport system substrate-binding protein